MYPAQANNAYIFPAIGHAAILTYCSTISDEIFLLAAEQLSSMSSMQQLQQGQLFPHFDEVREVSACLAAHLAAFMVDEGLGVKPPSMASGDSSGWEPLVRISMYQPQFTTTLQAAPSKL